MDGWPASQLQAGSDAGGWPIVGLGPWIAHQVTGWFGMNVKYHFCESVLGTSMDGRGAACRVEVRWCCLYYGASAFADC